MLQFEAPCLALCIMLCIPTLSAILHWSSKTSIFPKVLSSYINLVTQPCNMIIYMVTAVSGYKNKYIMVALGRTLYTTY